MRKFSLLRTFVVVASAGLVLVGCKSKIDLDNIDTTSEVEMGLALPVGSIKASVGDFIGGIKNIYVDTLNGEPVIAWKDTFSIARNYHQIDLSQYVSNTNIKLNVHDKVAAIPAHTDPKTVTLTFDVPLKLSGINDPSTVASERLDSAWIDNASFASNITRENLPLEWKYIDKITLNLGENVTRAGGNILTVYSKKDDSDHYGQDLITNINRFTMHLMKDRNLDPTNPNDRARYPYNSIDSCLFKINFTFTLPPSDTITTIPNDAKFNYDLKVKFIDYSAIWGWFDGSNQMRNEDTIDIASSWGDMKFISRWKLPFSDPSVNIQVVTKVAGAMVLTGKYLMVIDANGNPVNATFNPEETQLEREIHFTASEYLDPIHSALTDSTTNMWVLFDKDPYRGHIDKLFKNMPQKLGYGFEVAFDPTKTPQIRIVPNTGITVHAIAKLPLSFTNGLFLDYKDTIAANLSKAQIDSLVSTVNWIDTIKASDVKIVLKAKNTIPLQVKAHFRCFDENNNLLMDPDDPNKPFILFEGDTIVLTTPKYENVYGKWSLTGPGETTIIASADKKKLDVLARTRRIAYFVTADDESLAAAYAQGLSNVLISDKAGISINIGLTAHVDAILNFGNDNQNNQ